MLSVTSSTEPALTDAPLTVPLDAPSVTSNPITDIQQMAEPYPSTTVGSHGGHSSTEHSVTACHVHMIPRKSYAIVNDQQASCSSSLSCDEVSGKGASVGRPTARRGKGRQKTASIAGRMTSAHRVILPAAAAATGISHHGNVSTMSSSIDTKARLRALILSGSRHQQPQNGNSTVCHYCVPYVHSNNNHRFTALCPGLPG